MQLEEKRPFLANTKQMNDDLGRSTVPAKIMLETGS